jgi:hypothetical protein
MVLLATGDKQTNDIRTRQQQHTRLHMGFPSCTAAVSAVKEQCGETMSAHIMLPILHPN